MSSIAILVPVCSRNQNYNNFNEVPFVNFLYPSLLKTIDTKHEYKIFVGVDSTDEFYTNNIGEFYSLSAPSNIAIKPIILRDCEHKPAFAWNKLFKTAHQSGYDYFFQIGDDVEITGNWTQKFIDSIESKDGIGVAGCLEKWNAACRKKKNQPLCLENAFVGRKHYEFFGSFFNPTIENWFCDEWVTQVYMPNYVTVHKDLEVKNKVRYDGENSVGESNQKDGQSFRYKIKNIKPQQFKDMIKSDKEKVSINTLEFTSTLAVALLTTKKEYKSGQVHKMIDNYLNLKPSTNFLFDFFIIFDQGEDATYQDLTGYTESENIRNIFIKSLHIPDSQNMYCNQVASDRIIDVNTRLGKPALGVSSGPNTLFFEGMNYLMQFDYENYLILETDTRPIKDYWFDILHREVVHNEFLILGSTYKGTKEFDPAPWVTEHLNGVAIYKNNKKLKQLLLKTKQYILNIISQSNVFVDKHKITDLKQSNGEAMLCLNYDIAIYFFSQETRNKDYFNLLKSCDFIANLSMSEDAGIDESTILSKHPKTVILHQKL